MPAADLTVTNLSNASITIQTVGVAAGATYTIPFSNLVAWAKDPYLRSNVLAGLITINALGVVLRYKDADNWLNNIVLATIVYAS